MQVDWKFWFLQNGTEEKSTSKEVSVIELWPLIQHLVEFRYYKKKTHFISVEEPIDIHEMNQMVDNDPSYHPPKWLTKIKNKKQIKKWKGKGNPIRSKPCFYFKDARLFFVWFFFSSCFPAGETVAINARPVIGRFFLPPATSTKRKSRPTRTESAATPR